jgi:DNA-binding XRE family transcriptional regulator
MIMNLPFKLVEYRKANKLSQEELAAQLGVSRQSVSKWEQGLSFPETEKLIQLSEMMGASIDSLLKGDAESAPAPQEPQSFFRKNWLTILLGSLLVVACIALILTLTPPGSPPPPEFSGASTPPATEQAPAETTAPVTADPPVETTVPTESEPENKTPIVSGLENQDLQQLRSWFFDFARTWRLDYMPQFTLEDGAPKDAGEYLYWVFAINLDNWGEDKGTMTKAYVEETALMYFSTPVGQHRSHHKSWNYDPDTERYTAYPGSIKEQRYYLLNSIEVHNDHTFTVHATAYYSPMYGFSQEEEDALKLALFEGTNTDLIPLADLTIRFDLDHVFSEPRFESFQVTMLTNIASW